MLETGQVFGTRALYPRTGVDRSELLGIGADGKRRSRLGLNPAAGTLSATRLDLVLAALIWLNSGSRAHDGRAAAGWKSAVFVDGDIVQFMLAAVSRGAAHRGPI
jgi:hypothetical protein